MKEVKLLIAVLPILYTALAYLFWQQDAKIMACIMITLSFLFGCLVIGVITNIERK
jgi:hypothetical protein